MCYILFSKCSDWFCFSNGIRMSIGTLLIVDNLLSVIVKYILCDIEMHIWFVHLERFSKTFDGVHSIKEQWITVKSAKIAIHLTHKIAECNGQRKLLGVLALENCSSALDWGITNILVNYWRVNNKFLYVAICLPRGWQIVAFPMTIGLAFTGDRLSTIATISGLPNNLLLLLNNV